MQEQGKSKKVGQEYGEVRSSLPLEKLEPYLEKHIKGFKGPIEVKQFRVRLSLSLSLSAVWRPRHTSSSC